MEMKLIKVSSLSNSNIKKAIKDIYNKIDKNIEYIELREHLIFTFDKTDKYQEKIAKSIISNLDIFKKSEVALILSLNNNNITATYLNLINLDTEIIMKDVPYDLGILLSIFENYKKNNPDIFYIDSNELNEGINQLSDMLEISTSFFYKIDFEKADLKQLKSVSSVDFSLETLKKYFKKIDINKYKVKLKDFYKKNKKHVLYVGVSLLIIIITAIGFKYYNYIQEEKRKAIELENSRKLKEILAQERLKNSLSRELKNLFENKKLTDFVIKNIENIESLEYVNKQYKISYFSKNIKNFFNKNSKVIKIKLNKNNYKIFEFIDKKDLLNIRNFSNKQIKSLNLETKKISLNNFLNYYDNANFVMNNNNWSFRKYNSFNDFKKDLILIKHIGDYKINLTIFNSQNIYNVKYDFIK